MKVTVDPQGCLPKNHSHGCRLDLRFNLIVSACKPSNAKLILFAKLNYLPSCSHAQPNKLHNVNQSVIYIKGCEAFSVFGSVAEKIYFEVGELNICGSSSIEST